MARPLRGLRGPLGALGQTAFLLAAAAGVVAYRLSSESTLPGAEPVDVAAMSAEELTAVAADRLEAVVAPGAAGFAFDVVQVNTLYAKPGGPRIELRTADDPTKVEGLVDEYLLNVLVSHGNVTAAAFWMDIAVVPPGTAESDRSTAELFARVLERDGVIWRDDGRGWYVTDVSPGVGMDPATARLLPELLRSLTEPTTLGLAELDGKQVAGTRGSTTPAVFPGVVAADGAAFTEGAFSVDTWVDEEGRIIYYDKYLR